MTGRPVRRALTIWRRSIQARVVVSTMLLSALVVGAVGWLLIHQIADGLVDDHVAASQAEARNETTSALVRLSAATGGETDASGQIAQLAEGLVLRGDARGFQVAVIGPVGAAGGPVLLVDDLVDSRWTLTVAARELRRAGAPAVLPFALASVA